MTRLAWVLYALSLLVVIIIGALVVQHLAQEVRESFRGVVLLFVVRAAWQVVLGGLLGVPLLDLKETRINGYMLLLIGLPALVVAFSYPLLALNFPSFLLAQLGAWATSVPEWVREFAAIAAGYALVTGLFAPRTE